MCVSKAREWPRGWQMPGPWAVQNLQMLHRRDWQGRQMPCSSRGGGWAQLQLTDACYSFSMKLNEVTACRFLLVNKVKPWFLQLSNFLFAWRTYFSSQSEFIISSHMHGLSQMQIRMPHISTCISMFLHLSHICTCISMYAWCPPMTSCSILHFQATETLLLKTRVHFHVYSPFMMNLRSIFPSMLLWSM